jgi:hypothetical protein
MAAPRQRPASEPRGYTLDEVANYLGHARNWLTAERLAELRKSGFPPIDPLLERVDKRALDAWWDARSGILPPLDGDRPNDPASSRPNPWRGALRDGDQNSPRHRHP